MKTKPFFFVLLTALLVSGCSDNTQKREVAQVSKRVQQEKAKLLELASRHDASVDWGEALPDRGMGSVFTVDLTKALIRTNGQPVAMEAFLEDVSEKDGMFSAHFTMFDLPSLHTFDLRLLLHCSAQQAEDLLKTKPDIGTMFAVVARIVSVSRPAFEADDSGAADTYHIDFTSMPHVFYANGTCVDVLCLESGDKK